MGRHVRLAERAAEAAEAVVVAAAAAGTGGGDGGGEEEARLETFFFRFYFLLGEKPIFYHILPKSDGTTPKPSQDGCLKTLGFDNEMLSRTV